MFNCATRLERIFFILIKNTQDKNQNINKKRIMFKLLGDFILGFIGGFFLMPSLIVPIATVVTVVAVGTALSEGLKSPKAVAMFYAGVAKSCYTSTGSKRVACIVSA